MDRLLAEDASLPPILPLHLDLGSDLSVSSKAARLKLMIASTVEILKDSQSQNRVLFICDDVNLLHNECLAVLGHSGHQVFSVQ